MKKNIVTNIDKIFDNKWRLGIMSILMVNDWVDFVSLRENLGGIADGTLANHINVLEKAAYIEIRKQFVGKRPQTSYSATLSGRNAFNKHLDLLEKMIKDIR